MSRLENARESEIRYIREQNQLEVEKSRQLSVIDTDKFNNMVKAIGADTIRSIAVAGPEMQVSAI